MSRARPGVVRLQSHKGNQTTLNKLQTASLLGTLNPEAGDEVREADAGAWSTVARRDRRHVGIGLISDVGDNGGGERD